ncbi:MAG: MaoC family dehydratase [Polyangiaceae bacterium]|nr:MaoC family dehydratase [Polyangiaceae bacterium]
MIHAPQYGRRLDDFTPGAIYAHPWEVTIDDGMVALSAACFQDAMPVFASSVQAKALGFRARPVHPSVLLNLALSFSVHDVSEQAIAHLAYLDVRFPNACYVGDTVTATSRVLDVKPSSKGDRGVVEVRTVLANEHGVAVCRFDRRALVRAGRVEGRPADPWAGAEAADDPNALPPELRQAIAPAPRAAGFAGFFEDFAVGDTFSHAVGKTISDAEHMMLTQLFRNTHPIHFDEIYCRESSFAKTRVVYGGLVLSWVLALASRDLCGNALWDAGLDAGAHPNGTLGGDTLYASSRVLAVESLGAHTGAITLRVVGTKNQPGAPLVERGLFDPELEKKDDKLSAKVVEITRKLIVRKRPPGARPR